MYKKNCGLWDTIICEGMPKFLLKDVAISLAYSIVFVII
jgi:hypothetical protein